MSNKSNFKKNLEKNPETNSETNSKKQAAIKPTETEKSLKDNHEDSSLGFWSTVKSVLGAMIGVQSDAQREKDFEQGDPVKLILGGIIFTVLFILTILWFVDSALESAGQK